MPGASRHDGSAGSPAASALLLQFHPAGTGPLMSRNDEDRCAEHRRFMGLDAAFRAGDLEALLEAVEDPAVVPNGPMPLTIGSCLEYAIYHSPIAFIRTLLEMGADPNPADHIGFPPIIAALSCSNPRPGAPGRPDVASIISLLIEFGSDVNQRGVNDYTPLHMAVAERNAAAVRILLDAGADPTLRTRIDEYETPREMAEHAGLTEIRDMLAGAESRRRPARNTD